MTITTMDVMTNTVDSTYLDGSLYVDGKYYGLLMLTLRRSFYYSGKSRLVSLSIFKCGSTTVKIEYETTADEFDNLWGMANQRDISGILNYFMENNHVQL